MKKYFFIGILILLGNATLQSQSVKLEDLLAKAVQFAPINSQINYYKQSGRLVESTLQSGYYPKLTLDAQASYQSDVFAIPINLPNLSMQQIPKEQYKSSVNINQMIYDGGVISNLISKSEIDSKVNVKNVESNLTKIRDNVIKLYFSILEIQDNITIIENYNQKLSSDRNKFKIMLENGTATKGIISKFDLESIKLKQKISMLELDLQVIKKNLSELCNFDVNSLQFEIPTEPVVDYNVIKRPEIESLELKKSSLDAGKSLAKSTLLPKIYLFAQVGIGSPNPFNMFEIKNSAFYMTGIRLNWEIYDWSVASKNSEMLEINSKIIDSEKDNFTQNLRIAINNYEGELEKFTNMVGDDLEMIEIQNRIVSERKLQLENGTVGATDYFIELNTLLDLELNMELHKTKLLNAKINLQNISGNY